MMNIRHPLVSYFVIAYLLTWAVTFPIAKGVYSESWHFLGALGPTLSAVLMTAVAQGKTGLRGLGQRLLKYRLGGKWLIVLSPVALLILALIIDIPVSRSFFDFSAFVSSNSLNGIKPLLLWLLPVVSYGMFEEIGWRGFALPQLQKRFNAMKATAILTIFWGLWHIPMFFYRWDFSFFMVFGFFVSLFFGAVVLTFIYNSTGSVLATIVWHTLWNIVAVIDTNRLTPIMSAIIIIAAIGIIRGYGQKNLSMAAQG